MKVLLILFLYILPFFVFVSEMKGQEACSPEIDGPVYQIINQSISLKVLLVSRHTCNVV
jgi:hypothetical protein